MGSPEVVSMSLLQFVATLQEQAPFVTSNRLFALSATLGLCSLWLLYGLWRLSTWSDDEYGEDGYEVLLDARALYRKLLAEGVGDQTKNARVLALVEDALQAYEVDAGAEDAASVASYGSTASFFSYGESETLSLTGAPPRDSVVSLEMAIDAYEFGHGEYATGTAFLEDGLRHAREDRVRIRTLRAHMVGVQSPEEYRAKVHCLRVAFDRLFARKPVRKWFQTNGHLLLARVLTKLDRDVHDFNKAFDEMMKYISRPTVNIGAELHHRGVVTGGFFDVGLDFVLMDAFDDLAVPPAAVSAVLGNRWLPKQVVLKTIYGGVYTIVKAKSAASKPDTFPYYFYELCATLTPSLACGFLACVVHESSTCLGPDSDMRQVCEGLREVVMGYLRDIFSHEGDRYASAERLEKELFLLAKKRIDESEDVLSRRFPA